MDFILNLVDAKTLLAIIIGSGSVYYFFYKFKLVSKFDGIEHSVKELKDNTDKRFDSMDRNFHELKNILIKKINPSRP